MRLYHYLRKRGLALFMALVMCLSLLPAEAMAEASTFPGGSGDGQESNWELLDAGKIRELLNLSDGSTSFTTQELLAAVTNRVTLNDRQVTAFGISSSSGPNAEITQITEGVEPQTFYISNEGFTTTDPAEVQKPTTYTVTWDFNDNGATQAEVATVDAVTVPAHADPVREGYTFTGWLSGEVVYGGTTENVFLPVTGDVTYIAQWTENTYTITWISDGNVVGSSTAKYGETPVYGGEPLSKDGFTFKCWAPEITAATGDAIYTAVWTVGAANDLLESNSLDGNTLVDNTLNTDASNSPANGGLPDGDEHNDGTAPDEPETANRTALFNSAAPVYLWAKLKQSNVEDPGTTSPSGDMSVKSVSYKLIDEEAKSLENGGTIPLNVLFFAGSTWTETMQVTVEVDCPGEDKTFHIKTPLGVIISNCATETDPAYSQNLQSHTFDKLTLPETGQARNSGTLTYICKPDCQRSVVRFNLALDRPLWNGRTKVDVPNALTITNGSDETLFSADAMVFSYQNQRKPGNDCDWQFWVSGSDYAVPSTSKDAFLWCRPYGNSSGGYYKNFQLEVSYPAYQEAGKDTLTYATPVLLKEDDTTEINLSDCIDETNHKLKLTHENCFVGNESLSFRWPNDLALTQNLRATGEVIVTIDSIVGGERIFKFPRSVTVYGPEKLTLEAYTKSTTRYNWFGKCEDLLYPITGIQVRNAGATGETNKFLHFWYDQTDKVGVRAQTIPASGTPVAIRYKTTLKTDWQNYPNPSTSVTAAGAGLADNEYFTDIQAIVPPYTSASSSSATCWIKMLQNQELMGENAITFWHGTMYNNVEDFDAIGNGSPVSSQVDISLKPSNNVNHSWASFYGGFTGNNILAGETKTVSVSYRAEYGYSSGYIYDPVFFVRLPKYLHLDENSVEVSNPKKKYVPAVAGKPDAEGYTVYSIHPDAGSLQTGDAWDVDGEPTRFPQARISMKITADLSAPNTTLKSQDVFFIYNNEGGSLNPTAAKNVKLWHYDNGVDIYTADCGRYSNGQITITAANSPVTFDGKAENTENCTFVPAEGQDQSGNDLKGGTAYVSGDGKVIFTFTLTNPTGIDISSSTLQNFYYDIPIFSAENERFSLVLDSIQNAGGPGKELDWEIIANADGSRYAHVKYPSSSGTALGSTQSTAIQMIYTVKGIENAEFGETLPISCKGLLVSPNSDNVKEAGMDLVLEVANGKISGSVLLDNSHGGAHTSEKAPIPGAKVFAINTDDPNDIREAEMDETTGSYTLKGLRKASYKVTVVNPGSSGDASASAMRFVVGTEEGCFQSTTGDSVEKVVTLETGTASVTVPEVTLETPHSVGYRIDGPNQAFANFGDNIFADTEWVWCNGDPAHVPTVITDPQYRHNGWTAKVGEQDSIMTVNGPITDNVTFTAKIESNQLVVGAAVEADGKDIHTTYDGLEHKIKLKVTDAVTKKPIENPTIGYFSDEACTTAIDNSFTDVCEERTVWVKVSKEGYAPVTTSVKVEIKPAPLTVKVTDTSMTYGDTVPEVTYEVIGAQNGETPKVEGTLSWKDAGTKPNVGTYSSDGTLTMAENGSFKPSNYELSLTQGTLTVGKRSVTLTSAGATKTYDGTPLTKRDGDVVTVTAGSWATGEGATYNVTGSQTIVGTGKNIFKYTLTSGAVAENYEIHTVYGDLVVTPRGSQETPKYQITVRANSLEATYNGSEFSCGGLERTLFKLSENGQEYRVEGLEAVTQTATNANGEGVVVAITLKTGYEKPIVRDSEGNDVTDSFVVDLEPGKLVIKPCEITLTAGSASKPYDGTPLTCNTFSVSKGEFVGTDGVDCEFSGSVTRVGQSVENKITKVTAKEGTSTNLSNYHITFLPGTLTVTALDDATRIPIKVTAESVEVPYNGEKQSVTTFTVDGATNNVITVNGEKFTVDTTGLTANGEGTNVGEYPVKVTGNLKVLDKDDEDVSEQFKLVAVDGTLTIKKADLTLTSPDGEKVYDGTPLTATEGMKIEGLKDADKDKLHITITGTQTVPTTDAGVDNTFTYSFDDGTEKNYNVIPKYGKLKVTSRGEGENKKYEITLEPNSVSYVYNGQERTFNGFDPDDFKFTLSNGVTYTVTNVTASASGKDFKEGGYPVVVKVGDTEVTDLSQPLTGVVVKDDQGNDVSSQFIVKVKPATLVIQKAPLTLISKTLSKPYDAAELKNGNEPLEVANGWVNGEGDKVSYNFTGSVRNPGETAPNAFEVIWNGVEKDNYALDKREGQLSISSRTAKFEVTLTGASSADSEAYIYDGTEKSVSGFVGQETRTIKDQSVVCVPVKVTIDNREVTYYVTGLTSEATGINVSDSKETSINGTAVVYDADGNDVSSEFTVKAVSGKLIIKPRTVTLTSRDCTKVYDGTALTNDEDIVVGGDGWAKDEGASYKFTGSRTLVGDSTNEFSYTLQNNTDAGNYIISKVEGKLIVTAPDNEEVIEVKIEDVHKTYDGTTQTWEQKDLTFKWHDQTYTLVGSKVTASGTDYDANGYQMSVTGVENPVIHDSSGETVEGVFQIVVKEGRLYIDKRAVTVESGGGTWEYDGSTHTNHDVKVISGSFVDGEEPTYTFDPAASQTLVGGDTGNNKFICTPPAGKEPDLYAKDYDITYSYGTLKVTGRTEKYPYSAHVSVEPVTYDGQPKEAEDSKTEEITRNGIKYWVTYTWDSGEHTDVQDGGYKLTTTCTVYDAPENGNDVTSQFAPKITADNLVINPASLTVKVTFEDRAYDGSTDVKVKDVSITGGKVGSDDVAVQFKDDATKTGTVESGAASEEPKAVSYKDIKNALELTGVKSGNYVIDEVKLGTVTIGKAEPTVFLKDTEVTYNGKPAEVKADVTLVNGEKYEGEISYTYYSDPDGKEPLDGAPTDAGTYYVKASIAASGNYEAAESELVKLVINPAHLTVTVPFVNRAYDGSKVVNAGIPSITDGKVGSDDVMVQFNNDAAKTGTVEDGTASEEPKTVSYENIKEALELTGEKSGNYVIDKVELGAVTISKATVTVTANNQSKTYDGTAFTGFTYSASGFVTGEDWTSAGVTGNVTYVGNAVGAVAVGTYTITPVVSDLSATNYTFVAANGTLTISAQPYIPPYNPTPTPTPVNPTPVNPTPTPGGTTITDEETPLGGAVGLNDTDHYAYIAGYEDDTVRPTKNITRAEVATIFFRLMTEEFRVANWATENTLKDVQAGDWYNNAVSTCANAGIITGYTDGRFQPQKAITRAEFAVIAARFLGPDADDEGVGDFSDTADHWAAVEIRKAAKAGWITGDGNKFRPDDPITRAEVMVIVNRMLDRTPDAEHMLPDMKTWIDNPEGTWYYEAVQEATNGHDYERDELNVETWTAIQNEKNWKAIQAEWEANNGASAPKADAEPAEADGESK